MSEFSMMKFPLRGGLDEEIFDLVHFLIAKAQVARAHDSLRLLGIAGPDDGSGHGGMAQRPGKCHFADRTVVAFGYRSQKRYQRQVEREIWFRKVRMPPAPIVLGQTGRALAGHGAGQEARSHWGIHDDPNAFPQAVGQNLVFDSAMHQRIRRLQRSYWSDRLGAAQLLYVEVGNPNPTNLALAPQV